MSADGSDSSNKKRYAAYIRTTLLPSSQTYKAFDPEYEVAPSSFRKIELLGSGQFGEVYLAWCTATTAKHSFIAVKEQKLSKSEYFNHKIEPLHEVEHKRQRDALRNEIKILSTISNHPNIVQIIGAVTTSKESFCVLTEYCENGCLKNFLHTKFQNNQFFIDIELHNASIDDRLSKQYVPDQDYSTRRKNGLVTSSDLLWFALQVAQALKFLSGCNIVHRDVALRNVLLKTDFSIRLGDFGLARRINKDGYFVDDLGNNSPVPFRHTAPESLQTGHYSIASELWAYGVLLWEMFILAQASPYAELSDNECNASGILAYIHSGRRLETPKYAPTEISIMISQLWSLDPSQRPSFAACISVLYKALQRACPEMIVLDSTCVADYIKAMETEDIERRANLKKIHRRHFHIWIILSAILVFVGIAVSSGAIIVIRMATSKSTNQSERNAGNNSSMPLYTFMAYFKYNSELAWRPWQTLEVSSLISGQTIFNGTYEDEEEPDCKESSLSNATETRSGTRITYKGISNKELFVVHTALLVNKTLIDYICSKKEKKAEFRSSTNFSSSTLKNYCNESTFGSDRFIYFNGSCYASPKEEEAIYADAQQKCKHIPQASISRLAWITSRELLNNLMIALVTKYLESEQTRSQGRRWYVGAFQNSSGLGKAPLSSARKNWHWMNADDTFGPSINENSNLWAKNEPNDCSGKCEDNCENDSRAAVLVYDVQPPRLEMKDTLELLKHEYICEYR